MRAIAGLMLMALVAACGADGEPEAPEEGGGKTSVKVSGSATFGAVRGPAGMGVKP
ncbi:argininosuccinate lyase [Marimonas lutisalis]|uniref:argininosuccinate lyase n=1 Tax=Marimonas lutisalis TaxID=2545756 RepID=UPI0010F693C3|nr:argininosuccinate lyase [Marimonas lutisalis]